MVSTPAELKSFVSALSRKVDPARLDKATQMLRADRFQLFVDAKGDEVLGVVKSQGDASLIYSCRLTKSGEFSCCTQNLNVFGGLRGKVCKHILVLMVGLVQSNEMQSQTVLEWVGNSAKKRPDLDKDKASATFIRYKGAEAGEIDWRPTETMPEDYYAL
jgi:hypothetical protein